MKGRWRKNKQCPFIKMINSCFHFIMSSISYDSCKGIVLANPYCIWHHNLNLGKSQYVQGTANYTKMCASMVSIFLLAVTVGADRNKNILDYTTVYLMLLIHTFKKSFWFGKCQQIAEEVLF